MSRKLSGHEHFRNDRNEDISVFLKALFNLFTSEMKHILKKSDYLFLAAALISLFVSVALWFGGYREEGLFVGIWVPSILAIAIYIKLIILYHT